MLDMTKRQSFEPIGAVLRRIAARLATQRNSGAIDPQPIDKNGCTFGKEPERAARCPASRRVPGGDKSALGAGGNSSERYAAGAWGSVGGGAKVIQFVAVGSHAAGLPKAPLLQGGPAGHQASIHFAFLGVPSQVISQPCASAVSRTKSTGSPKRAATTSGWTP